jgi:hypothetical protein
MLLHQYEISILKGLWISNVLHGGMVSVADPVLFWPLDPDPGWVLPGYRIQPIPVFSDFFINWLIFILSIDWNLFLFPFKNKIIYNFVKYLATKKGKEKANIFPSSFELQLDPESRMKKIRIRDKHSGSATTGMVMYFARV